MGKIRNRNIKRLPESTNSNLVVTPNGESPIRTSLKVDVKPITSVNKERVPETTHELSSDETGRQN